MSTETQNAVVAVLNSDAGIYVDAFCGEQEAKEAIITALKSHPTPTYAQYQEWRETWKTATDGRNANARNTAWSRLMKDAGVTIPESTTPEAERKAAERRAERERLDSTPADELNKLKVQAMADERFADAKKYADAIKRQAESILKPERDAAKEEAKAIKELIKADLPLATLKAIHDAIDKVLKG